MHAPIDDQLARWLVGTPEQRAAARALLAARLAPVTPPPTSSGFRGYVAFC